MAGLSSSPEGREHSLIVCSSTSRVRMIIGLDCTCLSLSLLLLGWNRLGYCLGSFSLLFELPYAFLLSRLIPFA